MGTDNNPKPNQDQSQNQGGSTPPAQTEKVHTEQTRETTTPPAQTPDAK